MKKNVVNVIDKNKCLYKGDPIHQYYRVELSWEGCLIWKAWPPDFGEIARSKLSKLKYFLTQPILVKTDLHADRCKVHIEIFHVSS